MFRLNPLKCVPKIVPKIKSGVPKVKRWCALDPLFAVWRNHFFMGTQFG